MSKLSNNPPVTILELDQEMHDFLMRHCEINMRLILGILQASPSKNTAMEAVNILEKFKKLKVMLDK